MKDKKFRIGEKVAVIDDDLEGTVTAIDGNNISILTLDHFTLQFHTDELISREGIFKMLDQTKVQKKDLNITNNHKKKRSKPGVLEVDLHAHELFPTTKGMNKHDILTAQLEVAQKKLNEAMRLKIPKLILIHGIGKGRLREELIRMLRKYPIQTNEAPYREYGQGALEVKIFQNYKENPV